jgi:spermidine dehydrogenase
MNTEDKELGMDRDISRRDFLEGSLKLAGGAALSSLAPHGWTNRGPGMPHQSTDRLQHPPHDSGLRGSHEGSFEVAHQLAWEGKTDWGEVTDSEQVYDLVVVGAGVSGLAAAYFYREQHPNARILILDNHDDFGGHAKRNEFSWGKHTILGYGGSQSLEAPSAYSETSTELLRKLKVDLSELAAAYDEDFYKRHDLGSAIYFDQATYGQDVTLRSDFVDASLFLPLADSDLTAIDAIDQMPVSSAAKTELRDLLKNSKDTVPEHSIFSEPQYLNTLTYEDFLSKHVGVTEPEVFNLLRHTGSSYFGHGTDMIPAMLALGFGLPGMNATSLGAFNGLIRKALQWTTEPYIYHFPDGNASIARLLVRTLIDGVAPGSTMQDVVTAPFDYTKLDVAGSPVRLRLRSTVVNVEHDGSVRNAQHVRVTYLRQGRSQRVKGKRVVLACYNMAIPHICPELPEVQKDALAKLVKVPMCSTNVLLSNWRGIKEKGIGMVYSPGRWNKTFLVDFPVSMDGYQFTDSPDQPLVLHCLRGVTGEGASPEEQSRSGRYQLLGLAFEDYEREIRRHLSGMLAGTDFDPARDIGAITVNRWPHGYAWNPNPLFNPEYSEGEAPHEIGRRTFGRIAIANSDAGARAYLDCAIDEAARAVGELV